MALLPAVLHPGGRRRTGAAHRRTPRAAAAFWHRAQARPAHRRRSSDPGACASTEPTRLPGIADTARFDWAALDAWFEEDEQVFVHPRNPYVRVDALRSHRRVRVELEGVVLAETDSPVMVFETGLPTRYYLDRTDVRFDHLVPTDTETACPYKGVTTDYWSVRLRDAVEEGHQDLAWSYRFPTAALHPIAGQVAFYNEKVDVFVDGVAQPRPQTHLR